MPARTCLLVSGLLVLPLLGQPPARNPSLAPPAAADTTSAPLPDSPIPDSGAFPGNSAPGDTLAHPKSRADTVLVVKHRFDHREQIITGSVVMTCLALMMVIMNNYNPR